MPNIVAPNPNQFILDEQGRMTQVFRTWTQGITRLDLIVGTGSPEGVVSAGQGRRYMDQTGAPGSVQYIKRDAAIGGDDTMGWSL